MNAETTYGLCDYCGRATGSSPIYWGTRRFCSMVCCKAYAQGGGTSGAETPSWTGDESAAHDNLRAHRVDLGALPTSQLLRFAAAELRASGIPGTIRDRLCATADELCLRARMIEVLSGTMSRTPGRRQERETLSLCLRSIGEVRS